ncbi:MULTISPECIES: TonB-dependent receptor plug domain-containing protein [Pseudoalteromonas]|uniref:TonB-dependent receptor plug domain-containing protein n=1 Tax=Pseudoalteromonas TaxID=53246 RepID=UPI00029AF615|nr:MULTISPECIES: TonB-dependent receptor [Pseudoalteromonas]AUJ68737.1 Vitamin B12 transporter BtuB precursor [Pseudoalteromonas sp. NC201]MCF2825706.1 TonB-dependent receptor [Pseudoalteromonas sp. OF5H-5]MCF2832148.1 TonB-dependent receptor [Pseudoalteromonas sp. DL2-H6]MCF2923734.1 TonB-dependent receptor [Pseudoalteromonas sp. DL2-H1]MCF7513778.1 TonB-dependent receptor [Pseudoalteromonas sp. L7]
MKLSNLSANIRLSLLACSTLTVGVSGIAYAEQSGTTTANTVERIEVTGTRIKRAAMTGASPVTSVTAEDIEIAGITRVEDLLNNMPAVFADQTSGTANGATGTATVDLRNLGPSRTLVLVNGRRLPSGSPAGIEGVGADVNQIPASLVERVDVLTGGSSATYGSDAVAGVVNFIMKDDFEGFEVDYQGSVYNHKNDHKDMQRALTASGFDIPDSSVTDGDTHDISMIFGINSANDKGNITGYLTWREIDEIRQDSRDFSACSMNINRSRTSSAPGQRICRGSGTIPDGRITDQASYDFKVAGDDLVPTGNSVYNFGPLNYFQRPDKRKTFGLLGHYNFTDQHTFYAELNYMDNRTVAQIAPSGSFFNEVDIKCDNPLLSAKQREVLCGANGPAVDGVVSGAFIAKRNVEGGPRQDDLRHTSTRFVLGMRGEIDDNWTYDAFFNYGNVSYEQTYQNDLSKRKIVRALKATTDDNGKIVCESVIDGSDPDCIPWNIFDPANITQEQIDYLTIPLFARGDTRSKQISGFVTGDLTEYGIVVPGTSTGVGIVLGLEHRKEAIDFNPDINFISNDGAGQGGPRKPVSDQFDVNEFFTELNIPLIEDSSFADYITLELAYRYSDYSTDKQTDTYKAAFDIRINDSLGLRTSYQRAVRAGNIQDLARPSSLALVNWDDPCAGANPAYTLEQCMRTGVTADQYGSVSSNPAGQYNAIEAGNPDLKPEKSDTYSFGILYSPEFVEGLDIAVDYFDITVNDAIQPFPVQYIVEQCAIDNNEELCGLINRGEKTGSLWLGEDAVTATDTNIGSVETSGIDFDASYRYTLPEDMGLLRFSLIGTWMEKFDTQNAPGGIVDKCAGKWDKNVCESPVPDMRYNFKTTWVTPWDVNITATYRYVSEVEEFYRPTAAELADPSKSPILVPLSARDYVDIAATWNATENLSFRAGINNVFDNTPPLVPDGPTTFSNGNTYPGFHDILGRYIFAGFTFRM